MATSSDRKSDLQRLASYRPLSDNGTMVFYTRLSRLGYIYSGRSLDIVCEACKARVQIHKDWLMTRSRLRHESGCVFESLLIKDKEVEFAGGHSIATQGGASEIEEENLDDNNVQSDCAGSNGGGPTYTTGAKATPLGDFGFTVHGEFPDCFLPEFFGVNSPDNLNNYKSSERDCDKNPGHFAYFNANTLKPEQIPTQFRCIEVLNVLKIMSDLTVRIVVSTTSGNRRNGNQHKVRVGTGFVIGKYNEVLSNTEKSHFLNILNKTSTNNVGLVFIQTSRHLVYNDEEAQNTVVEFFYDSPDRKDMVSLEGKCLLNSTTPGDSQCLLVCECSDSAFAQRLNQLQWEFFALSEILSLKAKKGMSKKLFMIHHPHGGPKVLSYGDYVTVKYKYESGDDQRQPYLTKLTGNIQVGPDVSVYRKTLFHASDTCPGSCGAPILTFCPRKAEANGDVTFKLDIWMHHGVETSHKLGASTLKACSLHDFEQSTTNGTRENIPTIPDNVSLANQKVDSSAYSVIGLAAHSDYESYEARLASFETWNFGHTQTPELFASSGFFHTEGSDCVRCYQCGIGLRSWKKEDDVNEEHRKYSPKCPYLMSIDHQDVYAGAATNSGSSTTEGVVIQLLESENRTLKKQLTCKVCYKSDIKDVFLPCGEVYACSECSKLLTHCPSCHKPILATVTVYLT